MSQDISGFGISLRLKASKTFPNGFDLTQFADDGDPVDLPSIQVADKAMGLNGDLITWSKANPLLATVSVIANTEDDQNLDILYQANRPARGKVPARDKITLVISYPDGKTVTFSEGVITDGMPALSVASAGRLKTKAYQFAFENYTSS